MAIIDIGLDQIGIALTGAIAVWLSQDERECMRRFACIFGVIGQPFWFYSAYTTEQWGVFMVSILYAIAWVKGLWSYWVRDLIK